MRLMPAEAHPSCPRSDRAVGCLAAFGRCAASGLHSSKERMLSRITFVVTPTPPFRLDLTVWTARRRSGNAVDRWDVPSRPDAAPHVGRDRRRAGWLATPCLRGRSGTAPARRETTGDLDARAHAGAPSGSDGLPSLCPPRSEASAPCRTLSG